MPNIRGTHEYGTVNNMNGAWSARWSRDEADEFLFLVGDLWLIVDREELLGDTAQQSKVPPPRLNVSTKFRGTQYF